MTSLELNDILYEQFGAYSKYANDILVLAVKENISCIHKLVNECGYSFRLVRDILYTLNQYIMYDDGHFKICEELRKRLIPKHEDSIATFLIDSYIEKMTSVVEGYTQHDYNLDHIAATPETCYKRAIFICENFDINRCNILFVGDHDMSSVAVALMAKQQGLDYNIYVCDIDDNVLTYIHDISERYELNIHLSHSDFRYSIPNTYNERMDVVFTDPPYTPEGMGVFFNRSIQCMKNNPFSTICISYKTAEMSGSLGIAVQKQITKRGLYISELRRNFNRYYDAEALGCRSDLYICRITPATIKYLSNPEYANNIYTHGSNAVESNKSLINLDDFLPSLEEAVNKQLDTTKIYLIESGKNTKVNDNLRINRLKLRKYVSNSLAGKLNISKDGIVIFNCTNYNDSYQLRPLLLNNFREYYCLFTKEQKRSLSQNRIISFIRYSYDVDMLSNSSGIYIYRFRQKTKLSNDVQRLFLLMLMNTKSNLRNSFVKAATKIWTLTKNEARAIYDRFPLTNEKNLILFNLPLYSIEKLIISIIDMQVEWDYRYKDHYIDKLGV